MIADFQKKLSDAQGRSEFIIAIVCDIRGFSHFSTIHESTDLAMFIKRFYKRLLEGYFSSAVFAKPTGDGLFLIFRYEEATLEKVSESVLSMCFKAMEDFPTMFRDDPMINFTTPENLGFGVVRGAVCCLYSGEEILDYSGQLLNLAARLNDLARPKGVVVDGTYLEQIIPKNLKGRFRQQRAYIRSLAEETPREVFCSNEVVLPGYAQSPFTSYKWIIHKKEFSVKELTTISGYYGMPLKKEILARDKTKLAFHYPNPKLDGFEIYREYDTYECYKDAKGQHLRIELDRAKKFLKEEQLPEERTVRFEFQYVPKPKSKKSKAKS